MTNSRVSQNGNSERARPTATTKEITVDVCVLGAGIAGLTTAYLLMLEDKSVVVVDDGPVGRHAIERATAHLASALESRYCELEQLHGVNGSRLAAQSHTAAINCIEAIVTIEKIDCNFERVDGFLFASPGESADILERELAAAHRAGLEDVERLPRAPKASFDTGPCLRFPRQAQIQPFKYLHGLTQVIEKNGGRIFPESVVTKINHGTQALVETNTGLRVRAGAVVVATNTPVKDRAAANSKQAIYRTYVIGAKVPPDSVPQALYLDIAKPCHFARVHRIPVGKWSEEAYDLLLVGGEHRQTEQSEDAEARWAGLEDWARQRFPMICGIEYGLSARVMKPIDGLAFIGRNPMDQPNVYSATGDSGNSMTHGPIAGMLLTDLMCGRQNEWASIYDPSRITLGVPQETNFLANRTSKKCKQNQAGHSASECQL